MAWDGGLDEQEISGKQHEFDAEQLVAYGNAADEFQQLHEKYLLIGSMVRQCKSNIQKWAKQMEIRGRDDLELISTMNECWNNEHQENEQVAKLKERFQHANDLLAGELAHQTMAKALPKLEKFEQALSRALPEIKAWQKQAGTWKHYLSKVEKLTLAVNMLPAIQTNGFIDKKRAKEENKLVRNVNKLSMAQTAFEAGHDSALQTLRSLWEKKDQVLREVFGIVLECRTDWVMTAAENSKIGLKCVGLCADIDQYGEKRPTSQRNEPPAYSTRPARRPSEPSSVFASPPQRVSSPALEFSVQSRSSMLQPTTSPFGDCVGDNEFGSGW